MNIIFQSVPVKGCPLKSDQHEIKLLLFTCLCLVIVVTFFLKLYLFLELTFLTNFGVSISMNPDRTASRKLFWLLNVMRPEPKKKVYSLEVSVDNKRKKHCIQGQLNLL